MKNINPTRILLFLLTLIIFYNTPSAQCISDNVAPVITPLSGNIKISLGSSGTKIITLADLATITDNCNPSPAYSLSKTNFNCSNIGSQTILITATDGVMGQPINPFNASFSYPQGVAMDASGNIYVNDAGNYMIRKISPSGDVSNFAGNGVAGFADGIASNAMFNGLAGMAVDAAGNLYVAEFENHRIRKITPSGFVSTLAGSGIAGYLDGNGSSTKFNTPYSLATDASGNVYVADTYNHRIRKIAPNGDVTTVAGSSQGYIDGNGTSANFSYPSAITVDASGFMFIADQANHLIRKISPTGVVTTIAGNGQPGLVDGIGTAASFRNPWGIAVDATGNLFIADNVNNAIRKISPSGNVTTIAGDGAYGSDDGPGATAHFATPFGLFLHHSGYLYVADVLNHKIRKINTADNIVSTVAGSGILGNQNGNIGSPPSGNLSSLSIQVIVEGSLPIFTSAPRAEITVNTGASCMGVIPDFRPGTTATSSCGGLVTITQSPTQGQPVPIRRQPITMIATDSQGYQTYQTTYINVVDGTAPFITPLSSNITIPLNANGARTITLADVATVVDNCNTNAAVIITPSSFNCSTAGPQIITVTATDGTFGAARTPQAASFLNPYDLGFDGAGNLLIADYQNNKIKKLAPDGTVSTLAGSGPRAYVNGIGANASFDFPTRMAVDAAGNAFVVDGLNQRIRKVTPAGVVTTYAGSTDGFADGSLSASRFSYPNNIALDANRNLLIVDNGNNRIRKITPAGVVSTFAGDGSCGSESYCTVTAIGTDAAGNVYVAKDNKIKKITPNGNAAWIAGTGAYGSTDGPAGSATFANPNDIAVDASGTIWITDQTLNKIRRITTSGQVQSVNIDINYNNPTFAKGITISSSNSLFATFGNAIIEVKPDESKILIAGSYNDYGDVNGNVGGGQSGNQSTLQIPVTIVGQSTPIFSTTQANVVINAIGCSATLPNYISNAAATSSCGGAVTISQSPIAGTQINLGENTITLTATDASGNVGTQSFTVNVLKVNPPTIIPGNSIITLDANGSRTIQPNDVATISDCGHSPLAMVSPSTFNCSDIGTKTITITATDGTFGTQNPSAVKFNEPIATAVDAAGNLYIADRVNNKIRKITPAGNVTTHADGSTAAPGTESRIIEMYDMASDNAGNLYVTDNGASKIKKISQSGVITTFASNLGSLTAVTVSNQGIVYAASDNIIRQISPAGVVSSLAGSATGFADGTGTAAKFWGITGLTTDASGNIYVADGANYRVRKVTATGVVTTLAGTGEQSFLDGPALTAKFRFMHGITIDAENNLYVIDTDNGRLRKISATGVVSTIAGSGLSGSVDGTSSAASFGLIAAISIDANKNFYLPELTTHNIRKVDAAGNVTTLGGSGIPGYQDGNVGGITGNISTLQMQVSISDVTAPVITPLSNNIIVELDASGHKTITASAAAIVIDNCKSNPLISVSQLSFDCSDLGSKSLTVKATDGTFGSGANPSAVSFNSPYGSIVDAAGNIYIADGGNHQIRKITPAGIVSTFAGNGVAGSTDGTGTAAKFNWPSGLTIDQSGNIYVADLFNFKVRKITPAGVVTTFAGTGGNGSSDGAANVAMFGYIEAVAADQQGNIYVADQGNRKIRKISPSGIVSTYAGSGSAGHDNGPANTATFVAPLSVAVDGTGNVYVADDNFIKKISNGIVSTFVGNGNSIAQDGVGTNAGIAGANSIAFDPFGNLYATAPGKVYKITPAAEATTFAGHYSEAPVNGTGTVATFRSPDGISTDAAGNVYLVDWFQNNVRKITSAAVVTTIAGSGLAGSTDGDISGGGTGNESSLQIQVTVKDNIPPVVVPLENVIVRLGASGSQSITLSDVASVTDNCSATPITTLSTYAFNCANIGSQQVMVTATDGSGNTTLKNVTVIVKDEVAPIIAPRSNIIIKLDASGSKNISLADVATVIDNCGVQNSLLSRNAVSCSDMGELTLTLTVTDASGNSSSANIPVTVKDELAPTITPRSNIVINLDAVASKNITASDLATITDNCGYPNILLSSNTVTCSDLGTRSIVITATDASGNTSTITVLITVKDNTPPVLTCPENIITPASSMNPSQTGWATATDICTASPTITYTDTNDPAQGCYVKRTWKATDASGNFSTCIQTIATPQMSVTLGPDMYILYGALGYVGCHTIAPTVTGGVGPYKYKWTSDDTQVNNASSGTVSPCNTTEQMYAYTLLVTSANACTASATLRLSYVNISCSKNANQEKVEVCLRSDGNSNNCHTVCVSANAAAGLVNNGAYYGECLVNCEIPIQATAGRAGQATEKIEETFEVKVSNNPASTAFVLSVFSSAKEKITIRVLDATGKLKEVKPNIYPSQATKIGNHYTAGIYFAEVIQNNKRKVVRLVKQ